MTIIIITPHPTTSGALAVKVLDPKAPIPDIAQELRDAADQIERDGTDNGHADDR